MQAASDAATRRLFTRLMALFPCILVLTVAAALRFYQLDAQSFWNDEGNSARLSERALQAITIGTASDIHPPLYYYTLHFWRAVVGHSEFTLRSLSVVFGVLLVWLIYLIGRQFFSKPAAFFSALIAATNPFLIYYSQEARMYAMLAAWAALSTYLLLQISNCKLQITKSLRLTLAALYVLVSAAGLYTQYTFAFILFVHNLAVVIGLITRREQLVRRALVWAAIQLAILLLYLPWLPVALSRMGGWQVQPQSHQLGVALLDTLRLFIYGITLPTSQAKAGMAVAAIFILASLWTAKQAEYRRQVGFLALWWLAPVALILSLGLYREAYLKFMLISTAPLCLLLGHGLVSAWQATAAKSVNPKGLMRLMRITIAALAVLAAAPLVLSLSNLYFNPSYARDDYRGIVQHIRSIERPGDAVLLIAPNQWEVFTYYYADAERVYPLARARPPNPTEVEIELGKIIAAHSRLFVLYWGDAEADPQRVYELWLMQHTYKAGEDWWGKVRLAIYAVPQAIADTPQYPLAARLGENITLSGYTLLTPDLAAGNVMQLAIFWQASAPISERYKVFVHVTDSGGQIVTQVDREPGANLVPTTIWQPGQTIMDRYGVLIPVDAKPGRYSLMVGLYDLRGNRLPITQGGTGDALLLTQVEIR